MLSNTFPGAESRRAHWPVLLQNVRKLHAAGLPLLAGSDAGNPGTAHGPSLHHELAMLVEAGLSPLEALRSATSVPARHFDIAERGCLTAGCRADLLLIDGNPLEDIRHTVRIDAVWKNGKPVNHDDA